MAKKRKFVRSRHEFYDANNGDMISATPMVESDIDWLRAGRLREAARAGDKKAAKELKRMETEEIGTLE